MIRPLTYNSRLISRRSPKRYMGYTKADEIYYQSIQQGVSPKEAAKNAQDSTGLSLLTGQRMRSRGFNGGNINGKL